MIIHQLSVFMENKPGHLAAPCRVLADAGINMLTLSVADTSQFGILRLIVRDWEKAKEILTKAGIVVKVTEVVAIEVPDKPGGLADLLTTIDKSNINVEYMYAFTERIDDKAVLIFRFEDVDLAMEALRKQGVSMVSKADVFSQLGD